MKKQEFINQRMSEEFDEKKLIKTLQNESLNSDEICERFNIPLLRLQQVLEDLRKRNIMIQTGEDGRLFILSRPRMDREKKQLNPEMWKGDCLRFGFVSDNHLGSHFERIDILNLVYDLFQDEGIELVLHGGNFIEGESSFNKNEIHKHGFERQIAYAVEQYPYRKGIETWFVSGDDHEGWYNQREGIDSGDHFQMKREQSGLFDLKHLGYVEADIELNEKRFEHELWCRVFHPGGGSAYAVSYAPQKIVESYQPGEKPHILFLGHFHKQSYNIVRGVHVIQMACTCDQSIYMRKKKLEAHLGGGIAEFRRASDGTINRAKVEFALGFDKKFYKGKDKYWKM